MEARVRYRGRLVYAGAGTSGRLAVQDGAELMPTFNWPEQRLVLLLAGDKEAARNAMRAHIANACSRIFEGPGSGGDKSAER